MLRALGKQIWRNPLLWILFLLAVVFVGQYVRLTPAHVRAYDINGHLEYVHFVVRNWTVPASSMGWEMHQGPLYYFLAALWAKGSMTLGRSAFFMQDLQLLSLVLSIVTMGVTMWITLMLFPRPAQPNERMFFFGLLVTLPGIVFVAARVSNDALALPVLALFTALLLRWWKSGTTRDWVLCSVIAAVGMLVKFNVGIAGCLTLVVCLPLRDHLLGWKHCMHRLVVLAGLLAVIAGWFIAMRIHDGFLLDNFLRPSTGETLPDLWLPHRWQDFVSFSPVRMLSAVFTSTRLDVYDRSYLWEFFFKSAFFGEWQFPRLIWLARAMLVGGLFTLGLAVLGAVRALRKTLWFAVPLLVTLVTALSMIFAFRLLHGFSSGQDFRFVPHAAIPVAAFAAYAISTLRERTRTVAELVLLCFILLCAFFINMVPFAG